MINKTKDITKGYEFTPYYMAFNEFYRQIWNGISDISKNTNEINDLCYHRCFSAFWYDGIDDYSDRQTLLWQYIKPAYQYNDPDSLINKYADVLPIDNYAKDLVNDVCTAYDEPPRREFSTDTKTNDYLTDLYTESNVDTVMSDIYPFAKMTGLLAVMPVIKDDKLILYYSSPDMFRVWVDRNNPLKVLKYIYPEYDFNTKNYIYHEWTDENYRVLGKNGQVLTDTPFQTGANRYGRIPVIFLRINSGTSFIPGGQLDLIYNNLKVNKISFVNEVVAGVPPVPFANNVDISVISPDRPITSKTKLLTDEQGADFRWIEAPQDYINKSILMDSLNERYRTKFKIPDDTNNESGIARVISRQGLIEQRYKDIPKLIKFEKELAELIKDMANIEGLFPSDLKDINLNINFADERIYTDPTEEMALDKQKVNEYLMDIRDYYTKWGGIDTIITDNKFEKLIKDRKALKDKIDLLLKDEIEEKPEEKIEEVPNEEPIIEENLDEINNDLEIVT